MAKKAAYGAGERIRDAHKQKARRETRRAIYEGRLKRKPCSVCGTRERNNAHHPDYDNPLDVVFYCEDHHIHYHRMERRIKRALTREEA